MNSIKRNKEKTILRFFVVVAMLKEKSKILIKNNEISKTFTL